MVRVFDSVKAERTLREDVQCAYQSGNITLGASADLFGEKDIDSYFPHRQNEMFPNIDTNHGEMTFGGETVVNTILERRGSDQSLRWLELGAGLGIAAGQAHQDKNCKVDVVSQTALAPHYVPSPDIVRILNDHQEVRRIAELLKSEEVQECIKRLHRQKLNEILQYFSPPFRMVQQPYLEHQYIGNLPQEIQLPENKYDIAHERCGVLHYTTRLRAAVKQVITSLRSNGALICYSRGDRTNKISEILDHDFPRWQTAMKSRLCVSCGPESELQGFVQEEWFHTLADEPYSNR